jgi:hypothetical protein
MRPDFGCPGPSSSEAATNLKPFGVLQSESQPGPEKLWFRLSWRHHDVKVLQVRLTEI